MVPFLESPKLFGLAREHFKTLYFQWGYFGFGVLYGYMASTTSDTVRVWLVERTYSDDVLASGASEGS